MIFALISLLIVILIVAFILWILGQFCTDPLLNKIARIVGIAAIVLNIINILLMLIGHPFFTYPY